MLSKHITGQGRLLLHISIVAATAGAPTVHAAAAGQRTLELEEVVVTARKREESVLAVPVAMSVLSGDMLTQRAITDMDDLARAVPQLVIGEGGGTVQGGNIVLRGVSGADANPLGDQAVSFNVDGVQVARATIRRMAEMDMAQIEVLKGPQALFYGKNSPGGIISVTTADPTDAFSAKVSTGYETYGEEWRTEGYVSGPLTDTLGYRLAGFYSDMQGWVDSTVPSDNVLQPREDEGPDAEEWALRGTLKFEATEDFDARLKFTYNERDGASSGANVQFVNCPTGGPQFGTLDDCEEDDQVSVAEHAGPGYPYGTDTFLEQEQMLGALELNYELTDKLTLTSVTGFYDVDMENVANFTSSYAPGSVLPSQNLLKITEWSEELRLTSDFDGRFNFMVGAHLQDTRAETGSWTHLGALGAITPIGLPGPFQINHYYVEQDGEAFSVFGQVLFDVTERVEIALGARSSEESKEIDSLRNAPPGGDNFVEIEPAAKERDFSNVSPELSLTWRPTDDFTVYGSWKQGFLSGGFNGSSGVSANIDPTYDEQLIEGYELGIKAHWLDGALQTNLAVFSYDVEGLQVSVTQVVTQILRNAGEVKSEGAEFDFNYLTPIDGLTIYGALAYLDAQYEDYQAGCYRGQNAFSSVPCIFQINRFTGLAGLQQDLSGTEVVRSPEWSGNLGFSYQRPITAGLLLDLFAVASYSDEYLTNVDSAPHAANPSYTLFDAGIAVSSSDERWKLELIGKNLTEEYYWTRGTDAPFTGTAAGVVPGILGDTVASVSRGREILLRASYRFGE